MIVIILVLRYVGNLIISYEMFRNDESELAQLKLLEIGKWLEELDNGGNEFYLLISPGLKHVVTGTFIHMLYAGNLIVECKWVSYYLRINIFIFFYFF